MNLLISIKKELINDKTILVAISYVDSELGIKQNIKEIKKIINNYPKCYFHVDATQAIGKIKVDFNDMDFMSMSGHKIFGMKGIGLLIKKDNILVDLIRKASTSNATILSINLVNNSDYQTYNLLVLVENVDKLKAFLNDLYQMKEVIEVERLIQ